MDHALALRARAAVSRARELGIDVQQYAGKLDELEKEIQNRDDSTVSAIGSSWEATVVRWKEKRVMRAAAYLAGATLRQLGKFERVHAATIKEAVIKELPVSIIRKIAEERTGKSREFADEQVELMLKWFHDNKLNAVKLPVVVVAAQMRNIALTEGNDLDENDPSLRDSPGTPSSRIGEGSERCEGTDPAEPSGG